MPFTRISLPAHRMDRWQAVISATLQEALVSTFSVPEEDCFQLFEPASRSQRVINPTYLCEKKDSEQDGRRSEDFLLFHITGGKPRHTAQKQAFYQNLVGQLHHKLGVSPADVMIVISFTQPEDWSFSHGEMFSITSGSIS